MIKVDKPQISKETITTSRSICGSEIEFGVVSISNFDMCRKMALLRFNWVNIFIIVYMTIFFIVHCAETKIKIFMNDSNVHDVYTFETGDNVTMICKGDAPLEWKTPVVTDEQYEDFTGISISNYSIQEKNYQYASQLDIVNITFPFVGYYICFEKKNLKNSEKRYFYVHDEHRLAVRETKANYEIIYSSKYTRTVVPCRPTSPDVNVTLMTEGGTIVPLNNTDNCEYAFGYNPYEGYFFDANSTSDNCILKCHFSRKNVSYDYSFQLVVEPLKSHIAEPFISQTKKHFIVGDNLTLECTVDSDVYTDIIWEFPKDGIVSYDTYR
ncbi:vascular endothelial growth factor receptor 2-like [Harmonia axyridis]|uniref:vascular endothelial growth factor receptor 2-like n=1 Tax=Harmonia axyridis TaxID=115357 RepID=UPI001E275BD7|nr:vascular endothelial growth factor receptor 2-like [Harmonia axyridis]